MEYAELLDVFDDKGNDIADCYKTFIPGVSVPVTPQATSLSRVGEPRTLRFGVKVEVEDYC